MFSDDELLKHFTKNEEVMKNKKYKWYSFYNSIWIDEGIILSDSFWGGAELNAIKRVLKGDAISGCYLEQRVFRGSHIDVCIIFEEGGDKK